jgi:hypothetical protein
MAGKLIAGHWLGVGVPHCARKLDRIRAKYNRTFPRALDLLKPKAGVRIRVDYSEDISFEL